LLSLFGGCTTNFFDGPTLREITEADNLFPIWGQVRDVAVGQLNAPVIPKASQLRARNDSNRMIVEEQSNLLLLLSLERK